MLGITTGRLNYVSPGKYTFCFKSAKRWISGTFDVTLERKVLPIQFNYQYKCDYCLPKCKFPSSFSVCFTENHWSNTGKSTKFFEEIILPYLDKIKEEKRFPKEQCCLIMTDTFEGPDNNIKNLFSENNCKVAIVSHNLTNKSQPFDTSVNKAAKAFVQTRYNFGFLNKSQCN